MYHFRNYILSKLSPIHYVSIHLSMLQRGMPQINVHTSDSGWDFEWIFLPYTCFLRSEISKLRTYHWSKKSNSTHSTVVWFLFLKCLSDLLSSASDSHSNTTPTFWFADLLFSSWVSLVGEQLQVTWQDERSCLESGFWGHWWRLSVQKPLVSVDKKDSGSWLFWLEVWTESALLGIPDRHLSHQSGDAHPTDRIH